MPCHRWVGGKRWLAQEILARLPDAPRLFIPFYGGGGESHEAIRSGRFPEVLLSDSNPELICAHEVVRDQTARLVSRLRAFQALPEETQRATFLSWRKFVPRGALDRAVRFFVFIGCGYGGLWRENQSGGFSVPFDQPARIDYAGIEDVRELLSRPGVSLRCRDFGEVLREAGEGCAVYADPPYIPTSRTASFDAYQGRRFDLAEHRRLAAELVGASARGASRVLLSNSCAQQVLEVYPGDAETFRVVHRMAARAEDRVPKYELLVTVDHRRQR